MSGNDLAEWRAYYTLEPFGQEWMQAAMQAALTHNSSLHCKRARPVQDFLPADAQPIKDEQSPQEIEAIFKSFAARQNQARH